MERISGVEGGSTSGGSNYTSFDSESDPEPAAVNPPRQDGQLDTSAARGSDGSSKLTDNNGDSNLADKNSDSNLTDNNTDSNLADTGDSEETIEDSIAVKAAADSSDDVNTELIVLNYLRQTDPKVKGCIMIFLIAFGHVHIISKLDLSPSMWIK